jgi:hypothetical protein
MNLNNQTKTMLTVAAVLLLVYFLYNSNQLPIHNEGSLEPDTEMVVNEEEGNNLIPENMEKDSSELEVEKDEEDEEDDNLAKEKVGKTMENASNNTEVKYKNIPIQKEDMVKYFPQKDYAPPESDWMKQKFNSRNKARRGFKRSSYSGALRGNLGPADWDDYFSHNNNVFANSQTGENDKFLPVDETNGGFAVFKSKGRATCGSNQNCEPEDLFDVDKYLPQEVNDDWFEVQPEPISVKNRHLINITKPIGINTIGTSLRNASYDIRGAPSNPKFVVSPFLNSSIEPDVNLKPLL